MKKLFPQDVTIHKDILTSGACKVSFVYNNTKCPLIELTDERAQSCNLNQLTIKDFEEQIIPTLQIAIDLIGPENIQQSLELPSNDQAALIVASLINSSVVTYSKITTSSELRGKENLYLNHIKKYLNEQEINTHISLKHMRDKWIAHLDQNSYETAKTVLVYDPSQSSPPALAHHVSFQSLRLSRGFLPNFLSLAVKVLSILKEKQREDSRAISQDESLMHRRQPPSSATTTLMYNE